MTNGSANNTDDVATVLSEWATMHWVKVWG